MEEVKEQRGFLFVFLFVFVCFGWFDFFFNFHLWELLQERREDMEGLRGKWNWGAWCEIPKSK